MESESAGSSTPPPSASASVRSATRRTGIFEIDRERLPKDYDDSSLNNIDLGVLSV
jgi:hypothetical protein